MKAITICQPYFRDVWARLVDVAREAGHKSLNGESGLAFVTRLIQRPNEQAQARARSAASGRSAGGDSWKAPAPENDDA